MGVYGVWLLLVINEDVGVNGVWFLLIMGGLWVSEDCERYIQVFIEVSAVANRYYSPCYQSQYAKERANLVDSNTGYQT